MGGRFPHGRIALVTGASSGIGGAAALLLAQNGYMVYGASRRGTLPDWGEPGQNIALYPLTMDVGDEASVAAGIAHILQKHGRLDVLVHAAGNGFAGPIECSGAMDGAQQMDINYFGALRLIKQALPGMRERRKGLIILVGSVGGEFSIPYQTLYSSSKAALTMLSDGLRLELKPFGVQAALIMPGDVKTDFTGARRYVEAALPANCPEEYLEPMSRAIAQMEKDEQNGMPPMAVANAILKAAECKRPKARRVVGGLYRVLVALKRVLPYGLTEKLLYKLYS